MLGAGVIVAAAQLRRDGDGKAAVGQ